MQLSRGKQLNYILMVTETKKNANRLNFDFNDISKMRI